jgi:hypothetical protein
MLLFNRLGSFSRSFDLEAGSLGRSFNNLGFNLSVVGYNVTQFSSALVHGNWVLNGFLSGLETVGSAALNYATKAFEEASELEVSRIAGGGALSSGFDNRINFNQGLALYDDVRLKLAKSAAEIPGVTSDYTKIMSLLGDDLATALNSTNKSAEQLQNQFAKIGPEVVKNLVLNAKFYGQGITQGQIARSFAKLLDTGKLPSRESFIQKNPLLKAKIAKYEEKNGTLASKTKEQRLYALNDIFKDTFSKDQLDLLNNSFSSRFEAIRSYVLDPDVGLFGFARKFKLQGEDKPVTFFDTLSEAAKPFLLALTEAALLLTEFADPMQALGQLVKDKVAPVIRDFSQAITRGFDIGINSGGNFWQKFNIGFQAAFGIDLSTYDFAGAITRFFDSIASAIDNFGKGGKLGPGTKLEAAIMAFINGIAKVLGSVTNRVAEQAMKDPVNTLKVAFFLNPSAVMQFFILLVSIVPAIVSLIGMFRWLIQVLWTIGQHLFGLVRIIIAALATPIGLVVLAFAAITTASVIFSDWLTAAGSTLNSFSGFMESTVKTAGLVFSLLGQGGQQLKDAWDKLTKGDFLGAFLNTLSGLGTILLATLMALIVVPIVAIIDLLASSIAWLVSAIGTEIGRFGQWVNDWGNKLLVSAGETIMSWSTSMRDWFASIPGMFKSAVIDPIGNMAKSISDGFNNSMGAVGNGIGSAANSVGKFFGFADGNPMGNMLGAYAMELAASPSGAYPVFANSSEAIIPRPQALAISNVLSNTQNSRGGASISMVINNYSGNDIASEVKRALEEILG